MGDTELLSTNYSAASDYFRKAKDNYKEAKHKIGEANSIKGLGDVERELGHYAAAEQRYDEAYSLYRLESLESKDESKAIYRLESKDESSKAILGQANCLKGKGDNKLAQQDRKNAQDLFKQARPLYDAVGDILGRANCTKGLADIERELGHYDDAVKLYEEAFEDFGQLNNVLCQANCHKGKGDLAMDRGNFDAARQDYFDAARQDYAKALQLYSLVNNVLGKANCDKSRADLELKSRHFEEAASSYNSAMKLYNQIENNVMKASCIKGLGDVALGRSDTAEAIGKYQEALPLYQQEKDAFGEAFCQQSLGDAELALERPDCNRAKECYESAVALFRKMNSRGELALCLLGLADVEGRLSAPQEVMQAHLSEALKQSEGMGVEWLRPRITSPQDRRDHLLAALVKWKKDGRTVLANVLLEYQSLTASAPMARTYRPLSTQPYDGGDLARPDARKTAVADSTHETKNEDVEPATGSPAQRRESASPVRLFYSYSHEDEPLLKKLEEHLALLRRQGFISGWHDRMIGAGDEWKGQLDKNLEEAQVILLMISPSFLASDYCYDIETKRALERHDRGEAKVIPILLRPADWEGCAVRPSPGAPDRPATRNHLAEPGRGIQQCRPGDSTGRRRSDHKPTVGTPSNPKCGPVITSLKGYKMTGNDSEFWKNVLFERIEKGQVLIVVGTGVSRATNNVPTASWVGFLKLGLERCEQLTEPLPDGWADGVRQNINSVMPGTSYPRRKKSRKSSGIRRGSISVGG